MRHIILLPGMDGTGQLFESLEAALAPRFVTHVVSYPPDEKLNYRQLMPYVRRAVPPSEPYIVVAESFSGPLAIEHASARPANLLGLVLCASCVAKPLPLGLRWLRVLARESPFRRSAPLWLTRHFLVGRDCPSDLGESVRAAMQAVHPSVLAYRLRLILDSNVRDKLRSIEVPVLYIAGAHDRLIGRRGLAQISTLLRSVSTAILDGPHLLLQRLPHASAQEISRFMDQKVTA
ncbi:MAG: alpha/beta hydrolase [Planctomycetes bacterium]|nr:alpha/beta hydrolase [Planctomycetota bacterium]